MPLCDEKIYYFTRSNFDFIGFIDFIDFIDFISKTTYLPERLWFNQGRRSHLYRNPSIEIDRLVSIGIIHLVRSQNSPKN